MIGLLLIVLLCSCGALRWHSIEQMPADEIAFIRDGVFVTGEYVRSAAITEIDGKAATESESGLYEVSVGIHEIKVHCDETKGSFNSKDLIGKAKTLKFEAQIQRTYLVRCVPFTHWWIEDSENNAIVAGEKYVK